MNLVSYLSNNKNIRKLMAFKVWEPLCDCGTIKQMDFIINHKHMPGEIKR